MIRSRLRALAPVLMGIGSAIAMSVACGGDDLANPSSPPGSSEGLGDASSESGPVPDAASVPTAPLAISAGKPVRSFSFASMKRDDGQLLVGDLLAVGGTLDGAPFRAVVDGGVLHFAVPKLTEGAHAVVIALPDGGQAKGNLVIEALPPIDVPLTLTTLETKLTTAFDTLDADAATLPDSPEKTQLLANNAASRKTFTDWKTSIASASPTEREEAARVLAATEAATVNLQQALDELSALVFSRADPATLEAHFLRFYVALADYLAAGVVVVGLGLATSWAPPAAVASGALLGWMASNVATTWTGLVKHAFIPVDLLLALFSADVDAEDGVPKPFAIDVDLRRAQATDVGSVEWLAKTLRLVERARGVFVKLGFADPLPYPSPLTEKALPGFPSALTVEVIGNNNITATLGGTEDAPTIAFKTTTDKEESGTFRVRYKRAGFELISTSKTVKVVPKDANCILGDYNGILPGSHLMTKDCTDPITKKPTRTESCTRTADGRCYGGNIVVRDDVGNQIGIHVTNDNESFEKWKREIVGGVDVYKLHGSAGADFSWYAIYSYGGTQPGDSCHISEKQSSLTPGQARSCEIDGAVTNGGSCIQVSPTCDSTPPPSQTAAVRAINSLKASDHTLLQSGVCGTDIADCVAQFGP